MDRSRVAILFFSGVIFFFVAYYCYEEFIYSEGQVLLQLSDEYYANFQNYDAFFDYSQTLKNSVEWDSLELKLKDFGPFTWQETHVNFVLRRGGGGGLSYSGGIGCTVSLSDTLNITREDILTEKIEIGLSVSQLDSLSRLLSRVNKSQFALYKDGSVVISKYIGPAVFEMEEYQILRVGERMFLYGNYLNMIENNVYIGKKH